MAKNCPFVAVTIIISSFAQGRRGGTVIPAWSYSSTDVIKMAEFLVRASHSQGPVKKYVQPKDLETTFLWLILYSEDSNILCLPESGLVLILMQM